MKGIADQEVRGIVEHFSKLPDPRSDVNRLHLLTDVIVISVCGVLAGADGPDGIALWARTHEAWLRKYLALPHGIPSHDTVGRVLQVLNPTAFQQCFAAWLESLQENAALKETVKNDEEQRHVAIDGKTLRRSHHRRGGLGPLHLVSAWATRHGISLGQVATEEKSNEITAIPQLLEQLNLEKAVVTIDALGCQKDIAEKIVAGGGDYVLALKGNQQTLHEAVQETFQEHLENDFAKVAVSSHEEQESSHGREDRRIYYQISVPRTLRGREGWKNLRTLGMAVRTTRVGERETCDVRYYISSLRRNVKPFAGAVRNHWSIENTLHWSLDVTFREDESRVRDRHVADNLAWLRRIALTLLKQHPGKQSLAMKRRLSGWSIDFLMQVLTGKTP
jgi:predicted transposase YbfD/YdcC